MKHSKIHKEGQSLICILALIIFVINLLIFLYSPHWIFAVTVVLSALLLCFVTFFFRSPVRILDVDDPDFVISPCDGRVVVIEEVEETEYFHDKRLQVSIFMSPFNVHANWYPIEGKIIRSEHQNGRHKGAWLPKASTENERSLVVLQLANGREIAVRQIAGAMARRIVTYARAGHKATRNSHLGFIKFGSRVDLYLPVDTEMFVELGEAVKGNQNIIAKLNGHG